ncbi:mitochondrial import inner membrane translocase subunit Tim9 [Planococcus citri]|uniref:mitochondrial import inner membrane translocase subunit Tim9 n=1 Tax=Planococcus citri TaxID=170843 RepID=UPI0031F7D01F
MAAAQLDGSISEDQIKSFKDFLLSYNKLSETCFDACAFDFTQRQVKKQEESCALNCMEKYLKMSQRISQRFQEYQMVVNENALTTSQKLPGQ